MRSFDHKLPADVTQDELVAHNPEAELAGGCARLVVEREHCIAREGLEDAFLHHDAGAADILLIIDPASGRVREWNARAREELVPRLQQELAEFAARTEGVPRGE